MVIAKVCEVSRSFISYVDCPTRVDYLRQCLGNVFGQLGILRHVDIGGLQGFIQLYREAPQPISDFIGLEISDDEPTFAWLIASTCAADAMNICLFTLWHANLDNVADIREIHATSCHIRRKHDGGLSSAEILGRFGPLLLTKARMHLYDSCRMKRVAVENARSRGFEVLKGFGRKNDLCSGTKIYNSFEWQLPVLPSELPGTKLQ